MTKNNEAYLADLHTKAAYAHIAAAHQHSTGDHASAQELAQMALGDSVKAVRYTEEIAVRYTEEIVGDAQRSMAV
jgi:hypothetical protein